MKYLLIVNFQPGVVETPMDEWKPEEIEAHLDYYRALKRELQWAAASWSQTGGPRRTGPRRRSSRPTASRAPVVTDGPFPEFKEWVAGYQIVDVESEARAIEIAAKLSAVPGPGGRATEQPIIVRQIMEDSPADRHRDGGLPRDGPRGRLAEPPVRGRGPASRPCAAGPRRAHPALGRLRCRRGRRPGGAHRRRRPLAARRDPREPARLAAARPPAAD